MDPGKRIRELEAQVERLSDVVTQLLAERTEPRATEAPEVARPDSGKPPSKPAAPSSAEAEEAKEPALVDLMVRRVDHALRGHGEGSIETHIGSVWLSRLAVLLLMTALALSARTTFKSDALGPEQKVLLGYLMAGAFVLYGLLTPRRAELFSQAVLGCGLASAYFTTYAAFYIEQMRPEWPLIAVPGLGLGAVSAVLAVLVAVAHWRRSQTVAGIGLFLAYYTVVVSCMQDPTFETMAHALLTCALLAAVILVFHAAHHWILLSWVALIVTHLTYLLFFLRRPEGLSISDADYFWISNGFLTLCYVLFSLACILDARKTREYRRTVGSMSGVNSAVYFVLVYFAVRAQFPELHWAFRSGLGTMLLAFAVLAQTIGPRGNYLYQIYIAKSVVLYTLALQSYLSDHGEVLVVALSIECLGLAFSYRRSGIVVFKVLGLSLMGITFAAGLVAISMEGALQAGPLSLPSNWFSAVGAAFFFGLVAWFYESFVHRVRPSARITAGQRLLADGPLDLRSTTVAVAHAAAGALLLAGITLVEWSDEPGLPFLLTAEAIVVAGMGLTLRTPQIEVASVLLIGAAHVCYLLFLWMPLPAFEEQTHFVLFTVLLASFTYVGAHAWERYLGRFRHPEAEWEHHLVAALPYLAATFLLTTLLGRELPLLEGAVARASLGAGLLAVGCATRYPGVKASGLFALALALYGYVSGFADLDWPMRERPGFLWFSAALLALCVVSERLFVVLQHFERRPSRAEDAVRTLLVTTVVFLGAFVLFKSRFDHDFILSMLGFAVLMFGLGAFCRESRYRWGAFFLLAIAVIQAFHIMNTLSTPYRELSFAASALVLLAVSWAYTYVKRRTARRASGGEALRDG